MIEEKKLPPAASGFDELQDWFEALANNVVLGEMTVEQTTENIRRHLY